MRAVSDFFCNFAVDMNEEALHLLEEAGIKPTSNRLLVVRSLLESERPLSLIDLETRLETLERSSIFRVLVLCLEHDVIHAVEDGRGVTCYEICHGDHECTIGDMHAHFYCEKCEKVFCFEDVSIPPVDLPEGFALRSVNYMFKGLCPKCSGKGP